MTLSYLPFILIRITHIPLGSCVGWTQLPPAWRWAKYIALLYVLSAVRWQTKSDRQKNTNADYRIEIRHVGGYCMCDRYRQICVGRQIVCGPLCLRAAGEFSRYLFLPPSQSWRSDEDHVSREAVERNANPAEPDRRTAGFWCEWHSVIGNKVTLQGYRICWGISTVRKKKLPAGSNKSLVL